MQYSQAVNSLSSENQYLFNAYIFSVGQTKIANSMFDYYSRHSLLNIKQPLALIGFWGAQIPEIAVALANFSGVSTIDLERQTEHSVGMRLTTYRKHQSERDVFNKEHQVLSQALNLSNRPHIVFMRPQSFMYTPIQELLLRKCHCIYLKRNIFLLFSQILNVLDRTEQTRDFILPVKDSQNITEIAALLKSYEQIYSKANQCIDVDNKHPLEIAQMLFSELSS